MDNNENEYEYDNGFTNVSLTDTTVTGMESSVINLSDTENSSNNNSDQGNGGFSAADDRNVSNSVGESGGFVINSNDNNTDNTNNMNNRNQAPPQQVKKVVRTVTKNNDKKNKKLITLIIELVIFIILLIIIFLVFLKKPSTAKSELPKKTSQYYKICTVEREYIDIPKAKVEIALGIYQTNGVPKSDTIIVWKSKKGQIKAKTNEEQENAIETFASYSDETIKFEGSKTTNKNNYFKEGKVFLMRTMEFDTSDYSDVNVLVNELQTSMGMKCK